MTKTLEGETLTTFSENENYPSLAWEINDQEYTLAFGYMYNEPTAALFSEGQPEVLILIPKDVLGIAFLQGWAEEKQICECSNCDCQPHAEQGALQRDEMEWSPESLN
jgi:hypothetical protein